MKMKIKYLLLVTSISLLMSTSYANSDILIQGDVNVSINDLDGFAYKIPDSKRLGYFDSPARVEKTLYSILNMKHIVKYGKLNNLVDNDLILENINTRMLTYFPVTDLDFDIQKENRILLVREFLKKEEAYIQIQDKLKNSIVENELLELANEKYIVNKSSYITENTRKIDFISVIYNKNNKKEQYLQAKNILALIESKKETFDSLLQKYDNSDDYIEIHKSNTYVFDKSNLNFSKKIFAIEKKGVYKSIIDENGRFLIANIKRINRSRQKTFSEVRDHILENIKQKSAERKFNALLISLTQDKLKVNQEILAGIKNRYK